MLPALVGVIILAIIIYIVFRVLGSIALGLGLILIVFIASYLIFGSFPDLREIPIVGKYIPQLPTTTGEVIAIVRNVFYSLKVLDVSKDTDNRLLVVIANTGRMKLSGFKVFVDGKRVDILNIPEDPLDSGKVTVLQLDTTKYVIIQIKTEQGIFTYP